MTHLDTLAGKITFNLETNRNADFVYHKCLINILKDGVLKDNRTGVRTISLFGPQLVFSNVENNFPLITTKKIHWKSVVGELLWFLSGSTNKHELKNKYGVSIWDEWGDDISGDLGPIYGKQWVAWKDYRTQTGVPLEINQIQNVIYRLRENPDDRRMIVSAWNVAELSDMALPPCHYAFQLYSCQYPNEEKRRLSLKMNIRSWDVFLGGPFNIAEYALLLIMIASVVNMKADTLIVTAGDAHIYENHIPYIKEQLLRGTMSDPIVTIDPIKTDIFKYTIDDIHLNNYDAHPNWKDVPVAI